MKAAPPPKPAAPAPAAVEAPVEATPPADTVATPAEPAQEETPAAEQVAEEQITPPADQPATETETPEPDIDDGGEGPVTPVTGKRAHLRLGEKDEVGRLAAALMKRNRDMPMDEAVTKAKAKLGITPQTPDGTNPEGPVLPATVEATQQSISQKLASYKKAMAEVRFEDAADLQAEILTLTGHRSTLERRDETAQRDAAAKADRDFDSSHAKAVELYAFASDPASPGGKRMLEIEAELQDNDDPLYNSPHKPLKIAQMVAAELNIAPRKKGPPVPAAAQPKPTAPAAGPKGVVPSGSSRTVPPATKPAVDPQIAGIRSLADLRKVKQGMGLRI